MKLSEIFGCSDLIVQGEIAEVGDSTFAVDCDAIIGACVDSQVTIRKFTDWTCAQRGIPYEKGQWLLLFLDGDAEFLKTGNRHTLYRVRGGGDDGEKFIHGQDFLWRGMPVDGFPPAIQELCGKRICGQLLPREDVLRSLLVFRECFECRSDPVRRWFKRIDLKCDQSKVVDLRTSSDIGYRLVQEVQAFAVYKGPPLLE